MIRILACLGLFALAAPACAHADDELPARVALEPVMVTGELLAREEDRTNSSVSVHTGAEIERSAVRDVYDVIAATPNASLDDNDYGFGGMTLRGINGYGASGAGGFAVYSTTSTVVLDGVGLPRSALGNVDLSAFDLDTVEILRGPQSTSQGRNAMAGAVIVNTREPELFGGAHPQFRARLAGGNAGSLQGAGAFGMTLAPDQLALRIVSDQRMDDGDIYNATRGQKDWAGRRSSGTRIRAKWQPGGDGGAYSALLSAADLDLDQGSRYVLMSQEQARVSLSDAPQDYDNRSRLASLEQRLRLGEDWSLRAISAWIESGTRSRFDLDYGAEDQGRTLQQEDARGFSQELRLQYAGETLQGSVGAYYFNGRDGDRSAANIDLNAFLEITGLCGVQLACSLPLGRVQIDSSNPSRVRDVALFGEMDWALGERLTLTAGLRYDRENNGRVLSNEIHGDTLATNLAVLLLQQASVLPANGSVEVSRGFSQVLPKLAARYELFDGWYLGAGYSEGYRPGGDGYNQVSGRHFSFDSERTRNVEVSFKGRYQPWRLHAALNLFTTRWQDMQVQGGQGTDTYLENAGLAQVRGGELELRWAALESLQLTGGYGITRGRFKNYISTEGDDFAGNRLPKAPAHSGVLALEWMPLAGLMLRPELQWTGTAPANADNNPMHELEAHRLLNFSARWQAGRCTLFVSGSNLTDEQYRRDANNFSLFGFDVVSLGDGRRVFGGVEFELQ